MKLLKIINFIVDLNQEEEYNVICKVRYLPLR